MVTSLAKRRPSRYYGARKRTKSTMVLYRSPKPEMKHFVTGITGYSSATTGSFTVNLVPQGVDVDERVGNKIKIWNVEYCVVGATSVSIRMDMVHSPGPAPTNTFDQAIDRSKFGLIKTVFLHSGTLSNPLGYYGNARLPLGTIARFDGALGSNIASGHIIVRLTSPSAATITGYFRIWYTDV